jgi:hypothetical protein
MMIMMGRSLNELFEGKVLTWRGAAGVVVFVVVMAILQSLHSLINRVWWEPKKLQRIMEKQGWKGPSVSFVCGKHARCDALPRTRDGERVVQHPGLRLHGQTASSVRSFLQHIRYSVHTYP